MGDFNGDGKPDLAGSNRCAPFDCNAQSLGILINNGDGTFHAGSTHPVSGAFVATGDFNGDGKLDLAVGFGNLVIMLGNGDGTFTQSVTYSILFEFTSIVVADFNADGKLDIAGSGNVLLGNADGTFHQVASYSGGGDLAVADFNNDGKLDLANPAGLNGIAVYLGNGDGTFQAAKISGGVVTGERIVAGDFNGDGKADIATSGVSADVILWSGKGDATFTPQGFFCGGSSIGNIARGLAAGDFNHNGRPDLAVLDPLRNEVDILLGNKNDTFLAAKEFNLPFSDGVTIATGDLNGDHKADFVAVSNTSGGVFVVLNKGDGTFAPPVHYDGVQGPVALADFNRDGKLDIVTSGVDVLLGNGDGTFQSPISSSGAGQAITVADFNADGKLDVAVTGDDSTVTVLLGNGDGSFQAPLSFPGGGRPGRSIVSGDFNGDGKLDIATVRGPSVALNILLGNGDGTFKAPLTPILGGDSVFAADFKWRWKTRPSSEQRGWL